MAWALAQRLTRSIPLAGASEMASTALQALRKSDEAMAEVKEKLQAVHEALYGDSLLYTHGASLRLHLDHRRP